MAPLARLSAPPGEIRVPVGVACSLLVVAVAAAYANCFSGALVLDDVSAITHNPSIQTPLSWAKALSPPASSTLGGRPVANLTFALDQVLHGGALWGYHAGNLLIHGLSALALFAILHLTWERPPIGTAPTSLRDRGTDARVMAAALLWAVHPLLTNAVTYLSQRTEALVGLCYLLTLLCFIRGVRARASGWLGASVAACAMGMGVKEVMVTAPVAALLYDRTFLAGSFAAAWRQRRGYYLGLTSTWVLLAWLTSDGLAQRSVGYGTEVNWLVYARTECVAVLTYLRLSLWPQPLIFDYGPVFVRSWAEAALPATAILLLLAGTVWALARRPPLGFLAAWFFLTLAPTSSIVPVALQPIAENRTYLSSMAIATLVVAAACKLRARPSLILCLAAALALGVGTYHRNRLFHDETQLLADTVAKRPQNPRAQFNYANFLAESGQSAAAVEHYAAAVRLDPDYAEAHANYGNLLLKIGRPEEALQHYERTIALRPHAALRRISQANALLQLNRSEDAFAAFEQAQRLPRSPADVATISLAYGGALLRHGRIEAAQRQFELGLAQNPAHPDLLDQWAVTLAQTGKIAQSLEVWRRLLELKPTIPFRENYASALLSAMQWQAAGEQYQEILRLAPDRPRAHLGYALALFRLGRAREARQQVEEALRLQPAFPEARQFGQRIDEALAKPASP